MVHDSRLNWRVMCVCTARWYRQTINTTSIYFNAFNFNFIAAETALSWRKKCLNKIITQVIKQHSYTHDTLLANWLSCAAACSSEHWNQKSYISGMAWSGWSSITIYRTKTMLLRTFICRSCCCCYPSTHAANCNAFRKQTTNFREGTKLSQYPRQTTFTITYVCTCMYVWCLPCLSVGRVYLLNAILLSLSDGLSFKIGTVKKSLPSLST